MCSQSFSFHLYTLPRLQIISSCETHHSFFFFVCHSVSSQEATFLEEKSARPNLTYRKFSGVCRSEEQREEILETLIRFWSSTRKVRSGATISRRRRPSQLFEAPEARQTGWYF
ncbi:Protein CBG26662 [Caenorhabditis briggsae]|uniref:Protein CBG26662 n=1 Tax=Caenorhabditis briggsae TaxID=6238 RepID=B6IE24_CAEBR|nr:Protein CBG26662 [Caenorhabditis briggsae]CAS01088.1 Protein CBG26662 [Caenorhabditis briggsae]